MFVEGDHRDHGPHLKEAGVCSLFTNAIDFSWSLNRGGWEESEGEWEWEWVWQWEWEWGWEWDWE